jgi:hypothetical protein
MKRAIFLIPILLLSGCFTAPVNNSFPEVPTELLEACPDLKITPETEQLSEVLTVVVDNYGQYHECKIKVDAWVKWYKIQKQIFNSVN